MTALAFANMALHMEAADAGRTTDVLLVEDEENLVELVRGYLERDGFSVRAVFDGPSAVEVARVKTMLSTPIAGLRGYLEGLMGRPSRASRPKAREWRSCASRAARPSRSTNPSSWQRRFTGLMEPGARTRP